jgi:hypothetical protein
VNRFSPVAIIAMALGCSWMGGVLSMAAHDEVHVRAYVAFALAPIGALLVANAHREWVKPERRVRVSQLAAGAWLVLVLVCVALLVTGRAYLTDGTETWLKRGGVLIGLIACIIELRRLSKLPPGP